MRRRKAPAWAVNAYLPSAAAQGCYRMFIDYQRSVRRGSREEIRPGGSVLETHMYLLSTAGVGGTPTLSKLGEMVNPVKALAQVAEEVRRELAQQLGGGAPGAALAGAHIAREDAGEAAEQTDKSGLLPRAVRDLDRALEGASPTKIAAVGDELPQVRSHGSAYAHVR